MAQPPTAVGGYTDKPEEIVVVERVQANTEAHARMGTFIAIVAGVLSGILGVTGISGLLVFMAVAFFASLVMQRITCHGAAEVYFAKGEASSTRALLFSGALTYILAWMITYDSIYVF